MLEQIWIGIALALAIVALLVGGFTVGQVDGYLDGLLACKAQLDTRCRPGGQP